VLLLSSLQQRETNANRVRPTNSTERPDNAAVREDGGLSNVPPQRSDRVVSETQKRVGGLRDEVAQDSQATVKSPPRGLELRSRSKSSRSGSECPRSGT
jgi:hypothetical protein